MEEKEEEEDDGEETLRKEHLTDEDWASPRVEQCVMRGVGTLTSAQSSGEGRAADSYPLEHPRVRGSFWESRSSQKYPGVGETLERG